MHKWLCDECGDNMNYIETKMKLVIYHDLQEIGLPKESPAFTGDFCSYDCLQTYIEEQQK